MIIEYVEVNEPFNTKYPTWIIAFCPDTDSFFVVNERHFFWEYENDFETEQEAINFFVKNPNVFIDIENKIMSQMYVNDWDVDKVFLENTNKWYKRRQP